MAAGEEMETESPEIEIVDVEKDAKAWVFSFILKNNFRMVFGKYTSLKMTYRRIRSLPVALYSLKTF